MARGDATPEAVDTAMRLGAGHPMGPITLADYVGHDITLSAIKGWEKVRGPRLLRLLLLLLLVLLLPSVSLELVWLSKRNKVVIDCFLWHYFVNLF